MKTDSKSEPWPWAVALVALISAAYATSFKGGFIYDDISVMVNNEALRDWSRFDQIVGAIHGRPMISISFAIDHVLFGRNPFGYHIANLAAHAVATLSLFGIARRTFRESNGQATMLAFCAALLWALHPLQTEAVTYIIQRCECMMGMFFLLSFYCVVRGTESERKTAWYAGAIVAAALGAGCKQTIVVLPILVILYDRCFISGSFRVALKRAPAMLAGLLLSWVVMFLSLALSAKKVASAGFVLQTLTPFEYARSQFVVIVHYLGLVVWPVGLCFDYTWPIETDYARIIPCALLIALLVGICVWRIVLNRPTGFWGAFFFLTLAPTSSILPITDVACERRMYLPLAGIAVLALIGLRELFQRSAFLRERKAVALGLVCLLAGLLGYLSAMRNTLYRDSEIMWTDVEKKIPTNSHAWEVVGQLKLKNGDVAGAKEHLNQALKLKPHYPDALGTLGSAYLVEKNFSEAIRLYRQALSLDPKHAQSLYGLGEALKGAGRNDEAFQAIQNAFENRPNDAQVLAQWGAALFSIGRVQEAIGAYSEALRHDPNSASAHNGLGSALAMSRRIPEALAEFEAALSLKPDYADALYNRGNALEILGRIPDAVNAYAAALKANPDMPAAANALAWLLATSPAAEIRDGKAAVAHAEKACALTQSANPLMLDTLAAAYAEAGQFDKAAAAAENALKRTPPNSPLAREIQSHLELFKASKPYRSGAR